jgi:hypothetical protein
MLFQPGEVTNLNVVTDFDATGLIYTNKQNNKKNSIKWTQVKNISINSEIEYLGKVCFFCLFDTKKIPLGIPVTKNRIAITFTDHMGSYMTLQENLITIPAKGFGKAKKEPGYFLLEMAEKRVPLKALNRDVLDFIQHGTTSKIEYLRKKAIVLELIFIISIFLFYFSLFFLHK